MARATAATCRQVATATPATSTRILWQPITATVALRVPVRSASTHPRRQHRAGASTVLTTLLRSTFRRWTSGRSGTGQRAPAPHCAGAGGWGGVGGGPFG